jgi:hypothetical protein
MSKVWIMIALCLLTQCEGKKRPRRYDLYKVFLEVAKSRLESAGMQPDPAAEATEELRELATLWKERILRVWHTPFDHYPDIKDTDVVIEYDEIDGVRIYLSLKKGFLSAAPGPPYLEVKR